MYCRLGRVIENEAVVGRGPATVFVVWNMGGDSCNISISSSRECAVVE
jgi:hypothetical protein